MPPKKTSFFEKLKGKFNHKNKEPEPTKPSNPTPQAPPASNSTSQPAPTTLTPNPPSPPPYHANPSPYAYFSITATSIPQWLWSTQQCRAWIYAYCVSSLSMSADEAKTIALRFKGSGTYVYNMTRESWNYLMGSEARGISVYNYLVSVHKEEGAVPEGFGFGHLMSE